MIPTNIYEQLKRDEGMRLKPYRDSVGKLTIGVGRNLDDVGISEEEAEDLLQNDILRIGDELTKAGLESPHPSVITPREWVLVNMAFNMGISGLLEFRQMLEAYRAGDYAKAAQEMLNSKWETQVGDRAHRLSRQMETGEWV
jgi:lysozyme